MDKVEQIRRESYISFLQIQIKERVKNLKPEQKPAWGKMTAQHMIEHLSSTVLATTILSFKQGQLPNALQLESKQRLIYSEADLPRNLQNPAFQFGLPAYTHPTLEIAKEKMIKSIDLFFTTYAAKPTGFSYTPFMGDLSFEELLIFHSKHFKHHFIQFNLLPKVY